MVKSKVHNLARFFFIHATTPFIYYLSTRGKYSPEVFPSLHFDFLYGFIFTFFSIGFYILFVNQFLSLSTPNTKLLGQITLWGSISCLCIAVISICFLWLGFDFKIIRHVNYTIRDILHLLGGITVFCIFYTKRKDRLGQYIIAGTAVVVLAGWISTKTGQIEKDIVAEIPTSFDSFKDYLFLPLTIAQIGVLIEIGFFSFGLAYRTKQRSIAAKEKLIDINKKIAEKELNLANREIEKISFQKQITETELKALKAQFNPHFVANSLNSIKNLVQLDKRTDAIVYLSTFSELIRSVLDYSEESFISLEKEIAFCKLYLEIESLRFDKQFNYQIDISDSVDSNYIKIPPLLLQPLLENAIWHGLRLKEGKKELRIVIKEEKENQIIKCVVEDNGIGRERANQNKSSTDVSRKSYGGSITKDRIENTNKLYETNYEIKILDKQNKLNEPTGTRIEINIPV